MRRASVRCPSNGLAGSAAWFPGAEDAAVRDALCAAVGLDPGERVCFALDAADSAKLLLDVFDAPRVRSGWG